MAAFLAEAHCVPYFVFLAGFSGLCCVAEHRNLIHRCLYKLASSFPPSIWQAVATQACQSGRRLGPAPEGILDKRSVEACPCKLPTARSQRGATSKQPVYAIAASPFVNTRDKSFKAGPAGFFNPRSHWLTEFLVTFR